MRVDAHQHFWHYDPQRDTWMTNEMAVLKHDFFADDLRQELIENRFDSCIAVQGDQSEAETMFLLDIAARAPWIAAVVGWVDLASPIVESRLQFFAQFPKLRGFRHIVQAEPDDRFVLRSDFVHGLRELQRFGFTYDLLIYPHQLPAAIELVRELPAQVFVLDHIAKPDIKNGKIADWKSKIRELARSPNTFCKLSGLVTEANWHSWRYEDFAPFLDVVFEAFSPDRLMFGSDWPVCLLAGSYAQVVRIIENYVQRHAPADQRKIFGENALRFYGVETTACTCN